jgi:hypothetical protein
MSDVNIKLDTLQALHTTHAILECITAMNTKADALPQDGNGAQIMRENAKTLEGVAVQLSKGLAEKGIDMPFLFKSTHDGRFDECVEAIANKR